MIDSYYHISLNGVKYRLAEGIEGRHYSLRHEPLRPPNAQVVQGDNQSFQLRPDLVVWKLDDWSGGMGQLKFDPEQPNRWYDLIGVSAFSQPGEMRPGYSLRPLYNATTGTTYLTSSDPIFAFWVSNAFGSPNLAVYANNTRYLFTPGSRNPHTVTAITGLDDTSAICALVFDGTTAYFTQEGNDTLYASTTTFEAATIVDTSGDLPTGATHITELGPYVYLIEDVEGTLWEIAKTGAGDAVALVVETIQDAQSYHLTTLNGKVYLLVASTLASSIWEIVPTSAAGPGYGREIAFLPGIVGSSLWGVGDLLYFTAGLRLYYLQPGGSYGSLGEVSDPRMITGQSAGSRNVSALSHFIAGQYFNPGYAFFLTAGGNTGNEVAGVWEIDVVSGGFAGVAWTAELEIPADDQQSQGLSVRAVLQESGLSPDILPIAAVLGEDSAGGFLIATLNGPAPAGIAISPWYNFGLNSEKVLSAIRIDYAPFTAANTYIAVDVQLSADDEEWIEDIVEIAPEDTQSYFVLSTATTARTFTSLRFRIRAFYDQVASSSLPVVRSVELYAQSAATVKVWELLLDLADDVGHDNVSGTTKAANLLAAADTSVNALIDGYHTRKSGVSTTYDVVIDSLDINLDRPGEGSAHVVLREVG